MKVMKNFPERNNLLLQCCFDVLEKFPTLLQKLTNEQTYTHAHKETNKQSHNEEDTQVKANTYIKRANILSTNKPSNK